MVGVRVVFSLLIMISSAFAEVALSEVVGSGAPGLSFQTTIVNRGLTLPDRFQSQKYASEAARLAKALLSQLGCDALSSLEARHFGDEFSGTIVTLQATCPDDVTRLLKDQVTISSNDAIVFDLGQSVHLHLGQVFEAEIGFSSGEDTPTVIWLAEVGRSSLHGFEGKAITIETLKVLAAP